MRGLATQRLLPGERHHIELCEIERLRESGRRRVADREAFAVALIQSALGTRTPDVVPFQVKTMSEAGSALEDREDRHSRHAAW